jgi:hypothetical protein
MNVAELYAAAARAGWLTPISLGALTVMVGFRAPDETVLQGLALSQDYQIEYPTAQLTLAAGDTVVIHGVTYRVREVRQVRDGSETHATLSRQ